MDQEVRHQIQAGWNNWRSASEVLCAKKVLQRLKRAFHKKVSIFGSIFIVIDARQNVSRGSSTHHSSAQPRTIVRPAILYGTETAIVRKTEEKKMDVTEKRMSRWISGVEREDRIRDEYMRINKGS
ncbi:uncharacterized protein [Palaemon carinicauda]|uniref:uncharacterized protein n=1 Tax=Palaemon carinicauda TaxID=392227 RepID=UPI0035B63BB3